ncbi:MAG: uroporphyrinogen decarboxylase family protein [Aggregatilineales bacterium]
MDKRERLEKTIAGEATDRVPAALWRHWPGDDERAADLARAVVDFQQQFDWDFVKVTPASSYSVADYGVQDVWEGNLEGTRSYTRRVISRSLDWTELRPLDPLRGALGRHLEALQLITSALGESVPVIATVFNPLAQAKHMAGQELLIRHMRTRPERLHTGLNILTETTLRFIDALRRVPIAGLFYAVQHASYDVMAEDEYRAFGLPYDRKILDTLPEKWWFNLMHLHGSAPMFKLMAALPVQAINWHDRDTEPDLAQGKSLFAGAVCGGLSRWQHLHNGTPSSVREAARDAIYQTGGRRFILSTGCVIMVTTPQSNIRAVRSVVEGSEG